MFSSLLHTRNELCEAQKSPLYLGCSIFGRGFSSEHRRINRGVEGFVYEERKSKAARSGFSQLRHERELLGRITTRTDRSTFNSTVREPRAASRCCGPRRAGMQDRCYEPTGKHAITAKGRALPHRLALLPLTPPRKRCECARRIARSPALNSCSLRLLLFNPLTF